MTTIIGLTGGIATGKSTVSGMLSEQNIPIIDADKIAHEVVEPGTDALLKIRQTFGENVIDENGVVSRATLGKIVFGNPEQLAKLNVIVQPVIRKTIEAAFTQYRHENVPIVVLDAPLLFEEHYERDVDLVVVVYVDRDVQLNRLMARNQLSEAQANARIDSQLSLADKIAKADFVIDNSGDVEATRLQVVNLLDKVRQHADERN